VAELVDAKANSYVEASLNNTFPDSWLALAAGIKAYRFESCPDCKIKKYENKKLECKYLEIERIFIFISL
jgi:hypothetical protein